MGYADNAEWLSKDHESTETIHYKVPHREGCNARRGGPCECGASVRVADALKVAIRNAGARL